MASTALKDIGYKLECFPMKLGFTTEALADAIFLELAYARHLDRHSVKHQLGREVWMWQIGRYLLYSYQTGERP
jgi:hypothetical protein